MCVCVLNCVCISSSSKYRPSMKLAWKSNFHLVVVVAFLTEQLKFRP